MRTPKVGIIGFGMIGKHICSGLKEVGIGVEFVLDPAVTESAENIISSVDEIDGYDVGLIIEAAHAEVMFEHGEKLAAKCSLVPFSLTAFSDADLRERLASTAKKNGNSILIPHGAILGLDGLFDGREVIESVTVTTIKHPSKLGLRAEDYPVLTKLYEGPTADVCPRFPRNVNIHSAAALAGIGFERTRSILFADPETDRMKHVIEVEGNGLSWNLAIESFALGNVTGAYTPESALRSILRHFNAGTGLTIL